MFRKIASRLMLSLALLLVAAGARAADYVLAYVNGSTTYYLARNGTTGVQRVTIFDPTTCIWSCASNTSGTTAGTLNNSSTYGYLFQTVNGTRYFLGAPDADLALATSVVDNYYRWRTNGTYVYNRYSGTYSYYINLANDVARNTTANTASNARPYEVTTSTVASTSTNPTINGADVLTTIGTSNYTATGAAYRVGYTNYSFNSANHYVDANGNSFTGTPAAATLTNTWSLEDNDYASVGETTGVVNVSNLPESDITLTLTVTVAVSGGTPAAPAGTTLTASKEITIQGSVPSAPIINVSGNNVTLSTEAAGTTSIRYTLDGSEPTATNGTVYSGPIDLSNSTTSPVTIKAVTVRNGNASAVTTQEVTLTLPAPVITVDGSAGTATISASAGATIYYTTDGSTPTTASSQYTGVITGLAPMTTVKAIAVKDGWNSSSVASATTSIPSGVDGGVVTLFDYEDHNWSYYQPASELPTGYPDQLHSAFPRNVKITYYGNGNTVSTSNDANPGNNTFTASTNNSVKVGIDAPEHTFIYYKTLERDANDRFPYELIPNPFSVRPTYGSGDTRWRGFYRWRIKSITGGSVHDAGGTALGVGSMLDAETTYYFQPTDNAQNNANNATSMEIELEALWARMYVGGGYQASVGYERNFVVGGAAVNYPATYSAIYPNGTTNGTTAATMANITTYSAGTRTLSYDTKFEYINLTGGGTFTANNHYLCFGRGISAANNAGTIQGINATATDLNYTLRVESGQFSAFSFVRSSSTTVSGRYMVKSILGCDYDRATNTNNKLSISAGSSMFFSQSVTFGGNANKDVKTFEGYVKSGSIQRNYWDGTGNAEYQQTFYCGQNSSGNTYPGMRYLTIEGGEMGSVCGGRGVGGESTTYMTPDVLTFILRVKGGLIHGSVYGGAADNPSIGSRRFIITGGEIQGWIAGGCNGTGGTSGTGATNGNSYIYVGGDVIVGGTDPTTVNGTEGGQVFGAGRGISGRLSAVNNSHVVVADEATVSNASSGSGYVYGGSYNGNIATTSNVYIIGGTVVGKAFGGSYGNGNSGDIPTANITVNGGLVTNGVYGGSNSTGTVGNVTMHIDGGTVGDGGEGDGIFGGGYGQSTVISGNVDLTLGTTTQTAPGVTVYGDVYGGSALGTVNTNASNHTNVTLNKGIINGSLYGGGLGATGTAANVNGPVLVTVNGGTVNTTSADGSGAVYGCNNINGAPQSTVAVIINGTDPAPSEGAYALDAVYGGGNRASYAAGTPTVTVNNCDNSIAYVYGGGNAAHITNGNTDVTIYGGNKIGNVFGGGNGQVEAANISGDTSVKIHGGTIGNVFGGSNTQGTIGGTISVLVNKEGTCAMHIDEVYGGGNKAPSNAGQVTVVCTGDEGEGIGDVYGGARAADVTGDITLDISGGSIERLFGGNNVSGGISGDIVINIDWDEPSSCGKNYLGYVYGAGNKADYAGGPVVNIKNGTISHDAFGGGLEAAVGGSVEVNMLGGSVLGALYGGGALAHTNTNGGTTTVNLVGGTVNDVYGGGLGQKNGFFGATEDIEAYVYGDVSVILNGSSTTGATNDCKVTGRIFGCNNLNGSPKGHVLVHVYKTVGYDDDHKKSTNKDNTTYDVAAVYGGGNMAAYVPNNPATTTEATEVIIDGCDDSSIQYVYGGGNAASVPATNVTVNGSYEIGNIFGGGNGKDKLFNGTDWVDNDGANVGYYADGTTAYGTGEALVNAFGGTLHYVFGGSNTLGNVRTEAVAYLDEKFLPSCPLIIDEVYGGGNEAPMSGDIQIKLGCITSLSEIYGGARLANVGSADKNCDVVLNITSGHFDRVFGGNNIDGIIYGSITVNIEETGCHPITIGELYGCGNQAPYTTPAGKADPTINVKSFTSIGRIFGGGLGAGAVVTGNPTININETLGDNALQTSDYAGTTRTLTDGSTVDLPAHTSGEMGVIGSVFGGGNAAEVKGNTMVNIGTLTTVDYVTMSEGETTPRTGLAVKGVDIIGNVFGGGNEAEVTGSTNVVVGKE